MGGHAIFIPLTLTCKAVLFDMDGTLVDSTSVVERAWGWWAKRNGIPLEAVLSFSHGRPTIATMDHFLPGHDHAEELDEMARYEETELEGILAVPGAIQIVCALHQASVGDCDFRLEDACGGARRRRRFTSSEGHCASR